MDRTSTESPVLNAINRRLTALWALSEAGLGGLMHAFKLPFSGVFVGGFALLSVAMIAWHNQNRTAPMVRSWITVSAVKLGLSPHSPLTAYIAVSFQAFFSLLCFRFIPHFRSACVVTGVVSTLESALQRLLVLTLLFGVGFWEALNTYTGKLLEQFGFESQYTGSQWIVGGYLVLHAIAGLLIGWWAGKMPDVVAEMDTSHIQLVAQTEDAMPAAKKNPRSIGRKIALPLVLAMLGVGLWFVWPSFAQMLLRGAAIWLLWVLILEGPVLRLVQSGIRKLSGGYTPDVAQVAADLPAMRSVARVAWEQSAKQKGLSRLMRFSSLFFALGLAAGQDTLHP